MSTPFRHKPSDMDETSFLATFGGIYEHSPWIAEAAWAGREGDSLDTVEGLAAAMKAAVDAASEDAKLKLICAHPDLAGKAAIRGDLTVESRSEQAGAGLDQCSAEEFATFRSLNAAYKEKFGFPFIIAVKGLDRQGILAAFRARLNHDRTQEFETALDQIHRIAGFRLAELAEGLTLKDRPL
ncbi:2-oxo-4-hydroxy-4-carboxy-5-ureidoimidazoline decarboxylase [Kordiimonas marina]|uniref:2-oxo-4-hydroxy-4-carboxy-5-ureidoimidazoline decarboxylase n=1 Tax=Kordiimonas marina TaxID=2872312 RepID=UPI001FF55CD0|nr:2-oxo-4-hydroxy-4-carboxy-5-ureidoimidazoline decarboxylase [Kordiimonas marina]MCJ9430592.1 2-oxo-4-hydroxy-4-carboxy-5-ureidoimidazoline decarboxylase [Kordiimonas marina]